jgi:hypothetical protein
VSTLIRLLQPFTDMVRWGEPYDVEDDDPLLDSPAPHDDRFNLWA